MILRRALLGVLAGVLSGGALYLLWMPEPAPVSAIAPPATSTPARLETPPEKQAHPQPVIEAAVPIADQRGAAPAEPPAPDAPPEPEPPIPAVRPAQATAETAPGEVTEIIVWEQFKRHAAAQGFARFLAAETGLEFVVRQPNPGRHAVVFPYADQADLDVALQRIQALTGRAPR